MKKFGLFCLAFFYFFFCLLNPLEIRNNIINTLIVFVTIIMPSILPMYFIGNILLHTNFVFRIFYPLLNKLLHLSNTTSCTIYLLSLIMGNPTTSILITKALDDNLITLDDSKRLMRITFFMNPLFIINICTVSLGILVILGSIITSFILGMCSSCVKYEKQSMVSKIDLSEIISKAPTMLLNVLITMLLISIIKTPLTLFNQSIVIKYLGDLLDISSGLINVMTYNVNHYLLIILLSILCNCNGVCLFFQTKQVVSFLSLKDFFLNRLSSTILSCFVTLLIYFLFNC